MKKLILITLILSSCVLVKDSKMFNTEKGEIIKLEDGNYQFIPNDCDRFDTISLISHYSDDSNCVHLRSEHLKGKVQVEVNYKTKKSKGECLNIELVGPNSYPLALVMLDFYYDIDSIESVVFPQNKVSIKNKDYDSLRLITYGGKSDFIIIEGVSDSLKIKFDYLSPKDHARYTFVDTLCCSQSKLFW